MQKSYRVLNGEERWEVARDVQGRLVVENEWGHVGLITSTSMRTLVDGKKAFVGVHLGTDKRWCIEPGSEWISVDPEPLYFLEDDHYDAIERGQ